MPELLQRRLAGFRFETVPPALPEKLPRMDIAAFVGFAAAGPMHRPVAVEDIAHFTEIFGEDVALAWDSANHRTVWAQLGPAVRAFFQNGGCRCWVIRVAGEAETGCFPIPGLLEVAGGLTRPAFARARSPGSWFDRFECSAAVSVELIDVGNWDGAGDPVARLTSSKDLQPGDLLRLRSPDSNMQSFYLVEQLQPFAASPPEARRRLYSIQGRVVGCFEEVSAVAFDSMDCIASWPGVSEDAGASGGTTAVSARLVGSASSPPRSLPLGTIELELPIAFSPPDGFALPRVGSLVRLDTGGGVAWFWVETIGRGQDASSSTPIPITRLTGKGQWVRTVPAAWPAGARMIGEKLTFELHVQNQEGETQVISDLGFAWPHPRCWNALPNDQDLFPAADDTSEVLLSASDPHEALTKEAFQDPSGAGRFPLAGDGNEDAVFLPLFVPALPAPFLPSEHSAKDELERDGLNEFSQFLFLDPELIEPTAETLLADADFIRYQRPNARSLSGIHAALGIEEATLIAVPDSEHVGWKAAEPPEPSQPGMAPLLPHEGWGLSDKCDYDPNPPVGDKPKRDKFLHCALRVLDDPRLYLLENPDNAGTFTLEWSSADPDVTFVLQQATRPDFSDAFEVYRGTRRQRTFFGRHAGCYYFQARAELGKRTSNWSERVLVFVRPRNRYELLPIAAADQAGPEGGFSPAPLLDIHRSLLRLCAARGDLFTVLGMPQHFRVDDCLQYVALLKATGAEADRIETATFSIGLGEGDVFSFGSVYHPWLVSRRSDGELIYSPPDGAAVGILARRSLERGAWLAPANEVFRGMIALAPLLPAERQLELLIAQLNQVLNQPEGFLSCNADTLSDTPELRPINVRRLLILLRRAALRLGATYVFEPNGPALRRLVHHAFDSLLGQLFARGAFAGDTRAESYEVVTDDSINTPQTADLGQFRVDLKVAPSLPMTFVTVRLVQTGDQGVTTEVI